MEITDNPVYIGLNQIPSWGLKKLIKMAEEDPDRILVNGCILHIDITSKEYVHC